MEAASMMTIATLAVPMQAYATVYTDGLSLNIGTSNIEVKEAWSQIKNAALVHLVTQKMKRCIDAGRVLNSGSGNPVQPRTEDVPLVERLVNTSVFVRGVLDDGNVFSADNIVQSSSYSPDISTGSWLAHLLGSGDGNIKCGAHTSKGTLFDVFVYIYKNYRENMTAGDVEEKYGSVTEQDRLELVCNGSAPGLLRPASYFFHDVLDIDCDSEDVSWYTGAEKSDQLAYLRKKYEEIITNSGNPYLVPWDNIDTFSGVDGFYLYSNDFEVQCGSSSEFVVSDWNDSGGRTTGGFDSSGGALANGYRIDENGIVEKGYYEISNNTSRGSFVTRGGSGTITCVELVGEMNEHIKEYIQYVNLQVYNKCKSAIDSAIAEKSAILNNYLESGADEEKSDAQTVLDEYDRIQSSREYLAVRRSSEGEDSEETMEEVLASPSNGTQSGMPLDNVYTCRSSLPYIEVTVVEEADLAGAIEEEFYDACYDGVKHLAWVICPVLDYLGRAADGLSGLVEEFF